MPKKNYGEIKEMVIGDGTFTLWCDGRVYDPVQESYSPQYFYSIVTSNWRYDANDIHGAPNQAPSVDNAFMALLTMMWGCAVVEGQSDLFPEHVAEFGREISDELAEICGLTESIDGENGHE